MRVWKCLWLRLLVVDKFVHVSVYFGQTLNLWGKEKTFKHIRGLATELELHNVCITKILVFGQGKSGHTWSHKLLSGVKTHEKLHERERKYCHSLNLSNGSNRPTAIELLCLMWVIPVSLTRFPRKTCQLLKRIMTALRFLTWEVKAF